MTEDLEVRTDEDCLYIRMTALLQHLWYWRRLSLHATIDVPWRLVHPFRSVQLLPKKLLPSCAADLDTEGPPLNSVVLELYS